MNNIKYEVTWGVRFNRHSKSFNTLWEAQNFIKDSVFGDARFCKLYKIEELDGNFTFANHYDFADRNVERKMFEAGIVSRADYEQYYMGKEEK